MDVCVFIFDLLMADGEPLLGCSLRERRQRVAQALPNLRPGHIELAQSLTLPAPTPAGQAQVHSLFKFPSKRSLCLPRLGHITTLPHKVTL